MPDNSDKMEDLDDPKKLWPHPATSISDDEQILLRLLLAGIRDEYERPFVIGIDLDNVGKIIRAPDRFRHYPEFCKVFQEKVRDGEQLCEANTLDNMKAWNENPPPENGLPPQGHTCHMGLSAYFQPLRLDGHILGCYASGKIIESEEQREKIQGRINELKNKDSSLDESIIEQLRDAIPKIPVMDAESVKRRLSEGAKTINEILGNKYKKNKSLIQRQRRIEVQRTLTFHEAITCKIFEYKPLQEKLQDICTYLGTQYIAVFLCDKQGGTLLDLQVQYGLGTLKHGDAHFNWKKAKITNISETVSNWERSAKTPPKTEPLSPPESEPFSKYREGIKGSHAEKLKDMAFFRPFEHAGHFGAVMIGPANPILVPPTRTMDKSYADKDERVFLDSFCLAIGYRIAALVILDKLRKQDKERDLSFLLTAHMFRQGLQHILNEASAIELHNAPVSRNPEKITECVKKLEFWGQDIGSRVVSALDSANAAKAMIPDLQETHLNMDSETPAVIIEGCVARNLSKSQKDSRAIMVDNSVEDLPGIWCDAPVLSIAFDNLIENALKYSKAGTRITVKRGSKTQKGDSCPVVIEISNMGLEIGPDERETIFESGKRGDAAIKHHPQAGHGLGLSQVKRIIDLHKGTIQVANERKESEDYGFLTTFTVRLPDVVYGFTGQGKGKENG